MSRGRLTFKLSDLRRALKGAKAAGIPIATIKFNRDGEIEIGTGKLKEIDEATGKNEWDEVA